MVAASPTFMISRPGSPERTVAIRREQSHAATIWLALPVISACARAGQERAEAEHACPDGVIVDHGCSDIRGRSGGTHFEG